MKIVIFGASGSVGKFLIDEAVAQGNQVVAVSRQAGNVAEQANVSVQIADYTDQTSLQKVIAGSDAVIISLGDFGVVDPVRQITLAMRAVNVDRVEIVTGYGADVASRQSLTTAELTEFMGVRQDYLEGTTNKEKQVAILKQSGLTYTNVQPSWLTFDPATKAYRYGEFTPKSVHDELSRADLAAFMITNLMKDQFRNQSVYISGPLVYR